MKSRLVFIFSILFFAQGLYANSIDIFMVGDKKFCDLRPPQGMSRADWYKKMLAEQDALLKAEILKAFDISEQSAYQVISQLKEEILREEKNDKYFEKNIVGSWKNPKKLTYNGILFNFSVNLPGKYSITEEQVEIVKEKLRAAGFLGNIITSYPSDGTIAAAKYNAIYLMPYLFYFKEEVDRLAVLYHELAHIRNEDLVWSRYFSKLLYPNKLLNAWNNYVNNRPKVHLFVIPKIIEYFKEKREKHKVKSFRNFDKWAEQKALVKKWSDFVERRADLEAFFDLYYEESFQKYVAKHGGYEGCPFKFSWVGAYPYWSKVNYIKDFVKGIKNDYKLHLAVLRQTKKV